MRLLLMVAVFTAVEALCVRRTTTTTTTTTTTPTTTTTETPWHINLSVKIQLWSAYDPQNVTELMNKFPKASMEKALAPYEGGPITDLKVVNNSGKFEYDFVVPYVKNISLCYPTKIGNETSGNVCAVVDYKYCDVECYLVIGNINNTRLLDTQNKITVTVITTSLASSPNADSYVSSILQKAGDALESAEQFTLMEDAIGGYFALTITAISSNSCEQMKAALNSTLSTLSPTIVKNTEYSCSSA